MPRLNRVHKGGWKLKSIAHACVTGSDTNLRHLSKAILVTSRKIPKKKFSDSRLANIKEWR